MRLHSRFFLYFYFACFAALAFIEPAASQVVVTVTGTVANVTNGNPNSDPPGEGAVFGAAGNLSGDPFTLTMNFDPSEGTNSSASCSDGTINQSSNIGSDASAGPTAVLQIGGGSYTFGNVTPINMGWGITRGASLPPSCSAVPRMVRFVEAFTAIDTPTRKRPGMRTGALATSGKPVSLRTRAGPRSAIGVDHRAHSKSPSEPKSWRWD